MAGTLERAELVAAWEDAHGRPPPKGLSTRLLTLSAAYQRQAREHGGLAPPLRNRLLAIADPRQAQDRWVAAACSHDAAPAARPGTRLIREWRGTAHVVDVTADGVLYRGTTYPSLSAVAREITGARWSGPRFFGIARHAQGQ